MVRVNRYFHVAVCVLLLACVMLSITACSQKVSVAGEYTGESGAHLYLYEDGTCLYMEDDITGSGTGRWEMVDGTLYIDVSNVDGTLYAYIDDVNDGMVLRSDSYVWREEYFQKTKGY